MISAILRIAVLQKDGYQGIGGSISIEVQWPFISI
jgi:hypothetical protein